MNKKLLFVILGHGAILIVILFSTQTTFAQSGGEWVRYPHRVTGERMKCWLPYSNAVNCYYEQPVDEAFNYQSQQPRYKQDNRRYEDRYDQEYNNYDSRYERRRQSERDYENRRRRYTRNEWDIDSGGNFFRRRPSIRFRRVTETETYTIMY